jgi:hypothetical protein
MCTRGNPQIRQSEGSSTANKLEAAWIETRRVQDSAATGAIEGPAPAALAWIARIESSLLLKTASVMPTKSGMLPRCLLLRQYNGVGAC